MVVFYKEPGPYKTPHEKSGGACGQKFASDVTSFGFNIEMGGTGGRGQPMMHVFCYVIYRNTWMYIYLQTFVRHQSFWDGHRCGSDRVGRGGRGGCAPPKTGTTVKLKIIDTCSSVGCRWAAAFKVSERASCTREVKSSRVAIINGLRTYVCRSLLKGHNIFSC